MISPRIRAFLYGILFFFCSLHYAHSKELSKEKLLKIKGLIKLEYRFAAVKKNNLMALGGAWSEKGSYENFFKDNSFDFERDIDQKKLLEQIKTLYSDGHQIFFRKNLKFYKIKNGKFVSMRQIGNVNKRKLSKNEKKKKKLEKENEIQDELIEMGQCLFCQFRFSLNYVNIEGDTQYSGEVDWLPYFKLGDNYGMGLSIGATTYSVENDNLEQILSYGFKFQGFGRYLYKNYFFEAGLGQHYFAEYGETSFMYTLGTGYTFQRKHWFINEKIHLGHIFVNMSQVNWRLDITEFQFGLGLSF